MADVTVQFLGSGDAFGSGGRFQACILVRADESTFLLDCGASSLIAMRRFDVDPNDIDAIVVSHLHGDHFGGLPFFILDAQLVSRRERSLTIAGPPGLRERLPQTMEALFPGSSNVQQRFPIELTELPDGAPTSLGAIEVTPHAAVHASGAPSYALRVRCAGKLIAYSGDTEWTDALVRASDGADLFICEAYTFDKQVKFHLNYTVLASHRDQLRCRRLVLTHMSANMLRHLGEIDVEAAEDGMVIELLS
jgi:ribonuclease BN (tRNA processing enzyme)